MKFSTSSPVCMSESVCIYIILHANMNIHIMREMTLNYFLFIVENKKMILNCFLFIEK